MDSHMSRYVVITAMDAPSMGVHAVFQQGAVRKGKHCKHYNEHSDVKIVQTKYVAIIVTKRNIHFMFTSLIHFAIFVICSIKC